MLCNRDFKFHYTSLKSTLPIPSLLLSNSNFSLQSYAKDMANRPGTKSDISWTQIISTLALLQSCLTWQIDKAQHQTTKELGLSYLGAEGI
ncbi:Uncharacterized protein TCM_022234 [Theobroma cacao]|uniref:Uncharacterized protein n=1 Tax=Theobroma cacao TaxID=3641 RepID=A0A061ETC8_THECC|nr:Uncharacterized protein TCM_022234 [Theobroma cacao]